MCKKLFMALVFLLTFNGINQVTANTIDITGTVESKNLIFPLGVSENFIWGNDWHTIKFNPDNPEDMGIQWYLFPDFLNQVDVEGEPVYESFSEALVDRMRKLRKGEFSEDIIPDEFSVGENLEFGNVEPSYTFLTDYYLTQLFHENADKDDDGDDDIWTTLIPIYNETGDGVHNPIGSTEIIGFSNIMIQRDDDFLTSNSTGLAIKKNMVPEPTTMLLFGIGLLGIAGVSRKRKA